MRAIADDLALTYQTRGSRTRAGWDAFYLARDRFLHEQLRRAGGGFPFGTYQAPDGQSGPGPDEQGQARTNEVEVVP